MKRTAEQVVQEWRDSGSTDWGQLVSAINYWAMTDMCPELNAPKPQHKHADLIEAMQCPDCKEYAPPVPGSAEQSVGLGHNEGKSLSSGPNASATSSFEAQPGERESGGGAAKGQEPR